jgi:RNA polymerase sigma factor (sigma-70 family)
MQSDIDLIKSILKGKKPAERILYERHRQRWFRLALRYGTSKLEAQDIFQEGLVSIFKDLHQFDSKRGEFVHWSNRVLVNAALRFLKSNQWQNTFTDLKVAGNEQEVSENVLDKIAAKELVQIIQQMPLGYRVVFNMHVVEGFSHKEIAKELEISIGTSKSQLSKAKKALRNMLEEFFLNEKD